MVIDAYSKDIVCFCTHIEPPGNEDAISILSPFNKNKIAPFKVKQLHHLMYEMKMYELDKSRSPGW